MIYTTDEKIEILIYLIVYSNPNNILTQNYQPSYNLLSIIVYIDGLRFMFYN